LAAHQQTANQDREMLRVFCLGQFRVFRGSVELQDEDWGNGKGPTQKIKALFAFLLVRSTQGARKETLMDLFWPQQSDSKRASSSLHQALFHLRRALEPDLKARVGSSYVQCKGERYYFDPQLPCWVDADAFASCTSHAQALEGDGNIDAALGYWRKAVELYGGRFMAGIDTRYTDSEFYDWCAPRCRQLQQLYVAAAMTVARHHFDLGQHGLALEGARQVLAVDPASEPAHRLAMHCLFEMGHAHSAIAQYHTCHAELSWHEDRRPSSQTLTLYQRLLEHQHHLIET
jgi:DNA-binding SARP family transcriptional activator